MERGFTFEELESKFASVLITDKKRYNKAKRMIKEYLGFKPDDSMINQSSFSIFLANVITVFDPSFVKLHKHNYTDGNYSLSVTVEY